jgi:pyridoxal phosphate enzyme (YggS family)
MLNKEKAIANLDKVITDIEFARLQVSGHHIVQLIAISKYSTSDEVRVLYEAGQRAFGENKVQDLKQKMEDLEDLPIAWHFVGTLQKNKINNLIDLNPTLMHSLNSLELAQELDKKLKAKNKTMNCLLQVNSAKEDTKSGVMPEEAVVVYKEIEEKYSNIKLKGIMSIGAHVDDKDIIRKSFKTTKSIYDNTSASICSMGMSSDFQLAINEGSNMIRVGSALFK